MHCKKKRVAQLVPAQERFYSNLALSAAAKLLVAKSYTEVS